MAIAITACVLSGSLDSEQQSHLAGVVQSDTTGLGAKLTGEVTAKLYGEHVPLKRERKRKRPAEDAALFAAVAKHGTNWEQIKADVLADE